MQTVTVISQLPLRKCKYTNTQMLPTKVFSIFFILLTREDVFRLWSLHAHSSRQAQLIINIEIIRASSCRYKMEYRNTFCKHEVRKCEANHKFQTSYSIDLTGLSDTNLDESQLCYRGTCHEYLGMSFYPNVP